MNLPELTAGAPCAAIVPFGDDATRIDRARRRVRVQMAYMTKAILKVGQQMADVLVPAFKMVGEILTNTVASFREWGLIPPPIAGQLHGTTWTSPIDGTRWRVRGRRGRPHTFHWSTVGPLRSDRMLP